VTLISYLITKVISDPYQLVTCSLITKVITDSYQLPAFLSLKTTCDPYQ